LKLAIGKDGRNRALLSQFSSSTGRNQPSANKFVFGLGSHWRSLIKPPEGYGVAYLDWSAAEFGIAAALSQDSAMMADYQSDPYLGFGQKAGVVPTGATKKTHEAARDALKPCSLGLLYTMGPNTLTTRLGGFDTRYPSHLARQMWEAHHKGYAQFWRWSDLCVDHAMLRGFLTTGLGWRLHTGAEPKIGTLRNFAVQGACAEMLRLACCMGTEQGIEICAPIHDACLIIAPLDKFDADIEAMRAIMAEASRIVLGGFELFTDAKAVRYPDRFMDARGREMWDRIMRLIEGKKYERSAAA
jgi:DNA polymerase-1